MHHAFSIFHNFVGPRKSGPGILSRHACRAVYMEPHGRAVGIFCCTRALCLWLGARERLRHARDAISGLVVFREQRA